MQSLFQTNWENRSTVRSHSRIVLDSNTKGYYFPLSHQPLATHPLLANKDDEAINYLLVQSLYLYSHNIARIELDFVNQSLLNLVTNQLPFVFNNEEIMDAYLIMIDESYHAYVAYDIAHQVKNITGISSLPMPHKIPISLAYDNALNKLEYSKYPIFHLIAVCIAENTLTEEIVFMVQKGKCHSGIERMFKDHLSDEAKHRRYFTGILSSVWKQIDEESKNEIAQVMPSFIKDYLSPALEKKHFHVVLKDMGLSTADTTQIISSQYDGHRLTKSHSMIKSIINLFDRAEILNGHLLDLLRQEEWV